MSALNPAIENQEQKVPALPAWRVIWAMLRFRPWMWFVDLISVSLIRFCWQVAPALIIKAFFDMVTGEALDDKVEQLSIIIERLADQVAQLTNVGAATARSGPGDQGVTDLP